GNPHGQHHGHEPAGRFYLWLCRPHGAAETGAGAERVFPPDSPSRRFPGVFPERTGEVESEGRLRSEERRVGKECRSRCRPSTERSPGAERMGPWEGE